MTWINFVPFREATGRLEALYDRYRRPNDTLPNIISAHSLRPHILEGHMVLYRAVLGHSANSLPLWFLEAIGFFVSVLNKCTYCMDHHGHYGRLAFPGADTEWDDMEAAFLDDRVDHVLDGKWRAMLVYARQLTVEPAAVTEQSIQNLRDAGADDGEILEINQVAGYFAYANRVVLGLGVTLDGEVHTVPKG
jgi:uncharacterized peroxidase-related enzyme